MILEQSIENRIIGAIRSETGNADVFFSGSWSQASAGTVKGAEGNAAAVVAVTVQPRSMHDFGTGDDAVAVDFVVSVLCNVAAESDPTGSLQLELYEASQSVVWSWAKFYGQSIETDLTLERSSGRWFTPGGVQLTGGQSPVYSSQAKAWSWAINFTLRGIITE